MTKRFLNLILLLCVLLATPLFAELRVGSAQVDITPPKGMPMAGYYSVRLNEGVHDPLYAKAIVLEVGGKKAAMVSCDLVAIPREFVLEAREIIGRETGVPGDSVIVSATHTHTGPEMGLRLKGVDNKTMKLATDYHERLPQLIAKSVKDAEAKLTASTISAGIGHVDSVAFVRRFWMQDGTVGWNPGKMNPKIVRPTAEIDPSLPVVLFESPDHNPLALYVNYANHLDTVGGMEFSKDYPYTLAKEMSDVFGPNFVTVFTIGTAGNVNHIDVHSPTPQKGHGEAARIGTILAGETLETLRHMETLDPKTLKVSSRIVPLDTPKLEKDKAWADGIVARYGTDQAAPFYEQVYAFKTLDVLNQQGKPYEAEVQVISLGDQIAWVALPGEVFVELGEAIKIGSPYPYTIVTELANGLIGYIPNREAYPQGAYEVISTRVAAGSGEKLVDAAVDLLIEQRSH
ncbi:MAG: neutral/alkaline non-lysosomal ceramidase N-terminal domain-containing protein [Bryobacterales bacterium]